MNQTEILSQPVHDVRMLYDLKAPTRDGIKLSVDVFLPRGRQWPLSNYVLAFAL